MTAGDFLKRLNSLADAKTAKIQARFFKTGKGEYAEGDIFIGVKVPEIRKLSKETRSLGLLGLKPLLASKIHEARMLGVVSLVDRFKKADAAEKKRIFQFYWNNRRCLNNWDLIDVSAPHISGCYAFHFSKEPILIASRSTNMWERRIAILSTFYFIRQGDFSITLDFAQAYLSAKEDLSHKATGWMLREVGKRNEKLLESFLVRHLDAIPRTTLRYAIEKMPEQKRKAFLTGNI